MLYGLGKGIKKVLRDGWGLVRITPACDLCVTYLQEGEEFLERESKRPKFQLQEDEEELKAGEEGQAMVTTN